MTTKKFIIEVEEGNTLCGDCLLREVKDCVVATRLFIPTHNTCWKLNLITIKVKEENSEYINYSTDNLILDNSEFDYGHNITHTTNGE